MRHAALLALLFAPIAAQAHGDYAVATDVHFVEGDPSRRIVLETTFGLMQRDAKGAWRITCEEALSPGVKLWIVERSGSLGMGHAAGFATSTDGCGFTRSAGVTNAVNLVDRAVPLQSGAPPVIFLRLDLYEPGENVRRSLDGGRTFERVAYPEGLLVTALRADPNRAGRITATAQAGQGRYVFLDSTDLGATWTTHAIEFPDRQGFPRIFAATRSALFLRRTTLDTTDLWRSTDGGATWHEVLDADAEPVFLTELASGVLWSSVGDGKLYRSTDEGATWTALPAPGDFTCLREDGAKLYGCVFDVENNRGLLVSDDAGVTWRTAFTYDQVVGMSECPIESTIGSVCGDYWLQVQVVLNPAGKKPDQKPPTGGPADEGLCTTAPVGALALLVLGLRRRRHAS